MSNLCGAEILQDTSSMTVGIDHSAGEKGSAVPQAFLTTLETNKLFESWQSQHSNPDAAEGLLRKLKQISLSPPTLQAALLFLQYQKTDDLPKEFEKKAIVETGGSFSEAVPLFHRMLKVRQFPVRPKNSEQAELTLRMLLTVLGDVQLLTVFLVLQLHQLEQINSLSTEEADAIAWSSLYVHASLAGRLGIFWIKAELEDRAFRYLEYENYQNLKKKIARKRSDRSESVERISKNIQLILKQAGIHHEIQGRYKRFYSIFQKLEKVNNDFERIQDLIAFRVLVDGIDDCYAALSFIHENWTPVKNRFKDYICNPKPNGYQSLHTTVIDEGDGLKKISRPIEIQIRTRKMHQIAEYGVAAHWLYKEKRHQSKDKKAEHIEESLLEKSKADRYGETIPLIDLFSENIYVMTPAREIRELPKAATPIDFAYAIHTEIGNRTTGAKTNGSITRLDSSLHSGDTVEILTSPRQEPRKEWLDFVKTRHARNKIKHALHERNREFLRKEGLEMLEREFRNYNLNLNRLTREGRMEQESRQHKNQEFEHILFCIGDGSIRSEEVRRWFTEDLGSGFTVTTTESASQPVKKDRPKKKKSVASSSGSLILVDGMDDVVTRIAQCCSPERSHSIQGYLNKERVITIHRDNCTFLQKLSSERVVRVHWRSRK